MFLRAPGLFLHPRLWAEEGCGYYSYAHSYAHTAQWYRGITHTAQFLGGYVHLWTGIAVTTAANLFVEEYAAHVTLVFSVVAQLIPCAIVLWSTSYFWRSPERKLLGVLILLFAPISGEVWLNSLQSQVYFSIITFLLLIEDAPATTLRRWIYRVLLLIGGLSGPISCILTPVFLVEAYREKRRERILQAAILTACASLQTVLVVLFRMAATSKPGGEGFSMSIYGMTLGTQCLGPILLGFHKTSHLADFAADIQAQGSRWFFALAAVSFATVGGTLLFLTKNALPRERRIFLGAFFLLTFVSVYGAIDDKCQLIHTRNGQRYFFGPNIVLLLLVLGRIRGLTSLGSRLAIAMLLVALAWGGSDFRRTAIYGDDWPVWKNEVQIWRENPQYKMKIWPPTWTCDLNHSTRR